MSPSSPMRMKFLVIVLIILAVTGILMRPQLTRMLEEARRIDRELSPPATIGAAPSAPSPKPPSPQDLREARYRTEHTPRDYEARLRYASMLGQIRDYPGAVAQLEEASRLERNRAEPHLALAEVFEAMQWYDRALEERRAAVKVEPNNARALGALGYTYVAFGWHRPARQLLQSGVAAHPQDPALKNSLALTLYQMMDYHGALREILEAKRLDPSNHALDGPLIDVYMRLNDPGASVEAAERAMQADPTNPGYHIGRARALRGMAKSDDAEREIRSVLQRIPDSVEAQYELALILKQKKDDSAAQKTLEAVVGANPLYESATALLAQLYHRQGRTAEARFLEKTFKEKQAAADPSVKWSLKVANEPDNPLAHKELGKIHLNRKKLGRAAVELKETLRLSPNDAEARKLLRSALTQQGRTKEAKEQL